MSHVRRGGWLGLPKVAVALLLLLGVAMPVAAVVVTVPVAVALGLLVRRGLREQVWESQSDKRARMLADERLAATVYIGGQP
jgi:membrane protein implicated in regulation of membrane protease activity